MNRYHTGRRITYHPSSEGTLRNVSIRIIIREPYIGLLGRVDLREATTQRLSQTYSVNGIKGVILTRLILDLEGKTNSTRDYSSSEPFRGRLEGRVKFR